MTAMNSAMAASMLRLTGTVSYTHLDVYKRQAVGGTAAEGIVQRSIFVHLCALRIGHIQRVAARDDGRGPCVFTSAVGLACLLYTSRCV